MDDLFSLDGKIALITGGTSGIGEMIAAGFVGAGARTYIVGRNAVTCADAASRLSGRGRAIALPGDVSTKAGIAAVVSALAGLEDRLDVLVNNAGTMREAPIAEFSEEDWDEVLDLNLKSVFFLTQALLPMLRKAASADSHASVVNIGSVGGRRVGPKENYSYAAAKAGLHHVTGSLAKRLGPENITVNAIAPGFFPSKMTVIRPEMLNVVLAQVPRRRVGQDSDMAGAAIYLASRAGSFVNGIVLPVDGGMSL
ncbi:MAG: SDR family oxidoreductase [Janthinobacterium lividum]